MAALPAPGTLRIFDFRVFLAVGGEHDRELDRIVRVHFATLDKWYRRVFTVFPLKPHVEIFGIIGGLEVDQDAATLVRHRAFLGFFTGNHQVADIDLLVFVAVEAAIARDECALAAVVAALEHPLHRGLAGIKQRDFVRLD